MPLTESTALYLVFVEHQDDCSRLEHYVAKRRLSKSDILVIALGVETHKHLKEHSWRFRPLDEFFDLSSYEDQLWTQGTTLADTWFRTLPLKHYYYEQVAIPDFRRFFTHALACQIVLNNILPRFRTCRVILLPSNQIPLSLYDGYLPHISRNDVFKEVLRWYCRQHSLATFELRWWRFFDRVKSRLNPWMTIFTKLLKHFPPGKIPRYILRKFVATALSRQGKECADYQSVVAFSKNAPADVMIVNWEYDLERHMRLADVISHPGFSGMQMVHLVSRARTNPELTRPNHKVIWGKTPVPPRKYLMQFVLGDFVERWRVFRQCRQHLAAKHAQLFGNTGLDFQFLHFFFDLYGMVYCERYRSQELLERYAPRVYIASDIDTADMRARLLAAKEWGAITMTTNHGFYLYAPPASNFQGDYCLVGGTALKQNLMKGGVSADRIKIIGNPSFQLTGPVVGTDGEEKPKIVIITATPFDLWSFQYRPGTFFECVRTLAERLSSYADWHVIIKSHPVSDSYFCYESIVQQYGRSNLQHVSKKWHRQEFQGASVAVCLGHLSGSMLELQSFGVPIVYLDAVTPQAPHYDYHGCGVLADSTEEVCEAVERLIRDEKYRQAVVTQGFAFLSKYTNFPDNSLEKFSRVLRQVLQNSPQAALPLGDAVYHVGGARGMS